MHVLTHSFPEEEEKGERVGEGGGEINSIMSVFFVMIIFFFGLLSFAFLSFWFD